MVGGQIWGLRWKAGNELTLSKEGFCEGAGLELGLRSGLNPFVVILSDLAQMLVYFFP